MKLSVVVPNYNGGRFIKKCLNSILAQTYKPSEIIIADDASTDCSPLILEEYEEKYKNITVLYREKNLGVTLNRHDAINRACGDYITQLDSDDYYYDHKKLEHEMALIIKYKLEYGMDILPYSNTVIVDVNGNFLRAVFEENIINGNLFDDIITFNRLIPRDFIFSKAQYLSVGGYNLKIPLYEDWDFNIKMANKYEFYYSGVYGTAYRQHDLGLSSANYYQHYLWLNRVFFMNLGLVKGFDEKIKTTIKFYYRVFFKRLYRKLLKIDNK